MRTQPGRSRTDTLDYLQSMLGQLRLMAEAERLDMLTYLIEMAYVEASTTSGLNAAYGAGGRSETAPPE